MARVSQVLLLFLLSAALSIRVSKHRVHDDPASASTQLTEDSGETTQLTEDSGESVPGSSKSGNADASAHNIVQATEGNSEEHQEKQKEDIENNNQDVILDNDSEATKDNREKTTEGKRAMQASAFSAELSTDVQIASGSTIVFDEVLVNEGGLYFGTSGQFACPDEGVYVFMWTVKHSGSHRGLGALAFGGTNIKSGPLTSYYSSGSDNGNSQMVSVLQCRTTPLTAVTVRSMYSFPPTYSAGYTSFSGFRLAPDAAIAVAFTVELSRDVSLFPGCRIMFDNVISNLGDHYDALHGYFRCPDDGMYSFTVSAYYPASADEWSVSTLMFDGQPVLQGPMTFRATTSYDTGSSSLTILAQCQQDKDFYVEAAKSYTFEHTRYGADLTSFSGFRLCFQCTDMVAFSAVLMQNATTSGEDIPFGDVLLSQGDAYNPVTGVFTCPDTALYMFQWSATGVYCYCNLDLYRNGIRIKRNYLTRQASNAAMIGTSGTSSQSAVVTCNPGDRVSLRGEGVTTAKVILAGHTTFSGYRLPTV